MNNKDYHAKVIARIMSAWLIAIAISVTIYEQELIKIFQNNTSLGVVIICTITALFILSTKKHFEKLKQTGATVAETKALFIKQPVIWATVVILVLFNNVLGNS